MPREPKPLRAFTSTGNSSSAGRSSGSHVSGEPMPRSTKSKCASHLSASASTISGAGSSTSAPSSSFAHESTQRRHVVRVVHARHERVRVGVVEGRREPVEVGRDRTGSGALERSHDVDALPRAGEENAGHGPRGYRRAVLRRLQFVALGLVAAWFIASLVLFVWPPAESGAPRHADVVVVLSGSKRRLPPALALIRQGVAPVLAISSVERTKRWPLGR